MKRFGLILLISLMFFGQIIAQQDFGSEPDNAYVFAFQINTTADGQTVKCAVIYTDARGKEKPKYMPVRSWVMQFLGYEKSDANPESENFAEKYGVFEVPSSVKNQGEEEIRIYSIERTESILRNLWRLRYSQYPFGLASSEIGKGWAAHPDTNLYFMPSNQQFEILESYGINRMNDFFRGEEAFRLMRDILDKNWQSNYAKGSQSLDND